LSTKSTGTKQEDFKCISPVSLICFAKPTEMFLVAWVLLEML
jgi:hypothetical protein